MFQPSAKNISFIYDFNLDPSGGAIGTLLMPAFLPAGYQIIGALLCPISDFTSIGAANLSIGTSVIGIFTIINSTAYTSFNFATWGFSGLTLNNSVFPFISTVSEQITFSIDSAPITSGSFRASIFYLEF